MVVFVVFVGRWSVLAGVSMSSAPSGPYRLRLLSFVNNHMFASLASLALFDVLLDTILDALLDALPNTLLNTLSTLLSTLRQPVETKPRT